MRQTRRNIRRPKSRDSDRSDSDDLFSAEVRERLDKISAEQRAAIATKDSGFCQSSLVEDSKRDSTSELEQPKESISDPRNIGGSTRLNEQGLALPTPDLPESQLTASEDRDAIALPARALNEFVYCPRLFYYEFVEGIFVESADTLRGASIHRRVDTGTGAMPDAPSATEAAELNSDQREGSEAKTVTSEIIHSRSVSFGSERLGVTAKLDLVEAQSSGADGSASLLASEVSPVDYKAGSPRQGEGGNELWPTDKIQLGLQILLLRENGYSCSGGIIYYRGTKQRVPLEMSAELETWILEQIAAARRATAGPIPPPLVNSPKCVRCSLNSVCKRRA
jgi:CRISPR-associated protein Cas4